MSDYLGQPGDPTQPGYWTPALMAQTQLVYPNVRQRAAGQHWAACVVYPRDGNGEVRRFNGAARNVLLRPGKDSAALSSCANALGMEAVNCLSPHQLEVFGVMTVQSGTVGAELQASCLKLVAVLTQMSDPTAAGALTVSGAVYSRGSRPSDDSPPVALCAVVVSDPDRALTSTLRNLADGSLPMS